MNVKYDLVQGINFLKIPTLNIKKISDTQEMIKNVVNEKDRGFFIKTLFENITKEPNFVNIKNPSRDTVIFFSSRKDVSREIWDFRLFPKQEINYYLHEPKYLHCYVTQLNNSISLDLNWDYVKAIKNNESIDNNQLKYECLKIFEDEVIANGVTTWSDYFASCNWCRYFNLAVKTNQNYDLYIRRKNGLDIGTYESTLISGAGATSVYASLFYIPSNTASIQSIMENFSFGLKNNSGGADLTASLYIEMFG